MSNYSPCRSCGGEQVLNPKTGKVFCKNKCWLKGSEKLVQTFTRELEQSDKEQTYKKSFDEREDNIRWLNALNNATAIVSRMMITDGGDIKKLVREWADWFYAQESNT